MGAAGDEEIETDTLDAVVTETLDAAATEATEAIESLDAAATEADDDETIASASAWVMTLNVVLFDSQFCINTENEE
jgi:hypothetical protein